ETLAELWLRQDGADDAASPGMAVVRGSSRLADVVGRMDAEHDAAFSSWRRDAPPQLTALVEQAAPAQAGDDPEGWLGRPGAVEGTGPVPGLWQLGTGEAPGGGQPFRVGVPLLDESHLQVRSTPETRAQAESMVEMLVLRVLGYFRPGLVAVHVWDVGRFAGSLPGLYPLTRTGLLSVHDPAALGRLLGQLSERIRRVRTRMLSRGHSSLRAAADAEGTRTEPWVLVVLLGNRQSLGDEEHRQLQRVATDGTASGVSLVLLDVPATLHGPVETVRFDDPPGPGSPAPVRSSMTGEQIVVRPDPPVPVERLVDASEAIAGEHERWRGRLGAFADLLPAVWGDDVSTDGVVAPIGFDDGMPIDAHLDDSSPHALVGGPSGSGKTNLLLAWISAMAARYGPDELELYLLDFKEGVSFAQFAPGRQDPRWLPQARLVGVNINTDREFGLALLRFLSEQLRKRADAAKRHEVTKLAELRAVDPGGRWPRIVAVIDEFQYLFAEGDTVTREATTLLEDVLRRGRSQGIHLVFASQDVSGIQAFWGRPAIMEQFVLRIALPRARRILADLNDASLELPRWHAVVNHESGIRHGNATARIPDATPSTRSAAACSTWPSSAAVGCRPARPCSTGPARRTTAISRSRTAPARRSRCSGRPSTWRAAPRRSSCTPHRGVTSR
ncbi:MAG: FtsK/SpoIIIE domain-containing protein, partial [Actinomycetota bacterium]|nr:FtsK/SpoIIIE domain-containing protein [Actinomycetota bacterium]